MRIARLDGIRCVAVVMVLLFHHKLMNLGSTGVDLFFVLSGYLITAILRKGKGRSDFWSSFYLKRATRILPPVLLILAVAVFLTKGATLKSTAMYLFFLGDVEGMGTSSIPTIANMWSLAVEEHFYLIWPIFIRQFSRRTMITLCLGMLVVEPILRYFAGLHGVASKTIYFFTPFRLDGLLLGSLMALLLERPEWSGRIRRWSPVVGAGAIAALVATAHLHLILRDSLFYLMISVLAACIIGFVAESPTSNLSRVLELKPIVWMGLISYGIYLYGGVVQEIALHLVHTPTYPPPAHLERLLFLPDTLALVLVAWMSYNFYEHRIVLWGKKKADGNTRSETTSIPSHQTGVGRASIKESEV